MLVQKSEKRFDDLEHFLVQQLFKDASEKNLSKDHLLALVANSASSLQAVTYSAKEV